MRDVVLTEPAEADIEAAFVYLLQRNPQAARRLAARLDRCFALLGGDPGVGAKRDEYRSGMRCAFVRPYAIYYCAGDAVVEVVRVLHGSRDADAIFRAEG